MMLLRRVWRLLVVAALFAVAGVASAASQYYVRVTGTPAGITCDTTQFAFQTGATLSWNLMNGSSLMGDGSLYINGAFVGKQTISFQTQSGAAALSGPTTSIFTYPAQTFPYTVRIDFIPQDPGTDGVSVSFNCPNNSVGGGNGFTATVIAAADANLQASPPSLLFTPQVVGTTSASRVITITNTGTLDATGVSVSSSDNAFKIQANTCGTTIAVSASCTLTVAFAPTSVGARSASLTINRAGGSTPIPMTGTGIAALTIPTAVDFASQTVGTSSAPQVVTVTNASAATVNVSSVTSSNPTEFITTTNCGSIAAGASCSISITFHPTANGARASTITVTSDGGGSPQTISATGNGTGAVSGGQLVLPNSLTFGSQTVGAASAPTVVTVSNSGGTAVAISSITSSAASEFAISANTCASVNPGAQCTFNVTFTPAAAGARNATITVTSNGTGSPQIINASGTGTSVAAPGQLAFPNVVDAGSVMVGNSTTAGVPVNNIGGSPVEVSNITSSNAAEFTVVQNNCNVPVPAGGSCSFTFSFTPSATGVRSATLTITSNGTGSPQTMQVTGTGTSTPPVSTTVDIIEYHHAEWDDDGHQP